MTYPQFDKVLSVTIIPVVAWMLWVSFKSISRAWNDPDKRGARNVSIFFFILGLFVLVIMSYSAFLKFFSS